MGGVVPLDGAHTDRAIGWDALHGAYHGEFHVLGTLRGEGVRPMVAQVQPAEPVEGFGDMLKARHEDPPAAEDPDDGEGVGQG